MGLLDRISRGAQYKVTDVAALTWSDILGVPNSRSGVTVNVDTALRTSVVMACVRAIAEGIAQLPLKLFDIDGKGIKTPAFDNPIYKLISRRPNEWQTSFEFREMLTTHAVLTGNAYCFINRLQGSNRKIMELIPLVPSRVTPVRQLDHRLTYRVADDAGHVAEFDRTQIMHLRGPTWNGYLGIDAVQFAREAIGLAISTEETHARLHSNGVNPGGIISFKNRLNNDQRNRLRDALTDHAGLANKFKTIILDDSASWSPMNMTGVDSQHLETRRLQIEEVCRFMRVFPQMVMSSDKTSTFASAESFFLAHVTHSLMPWIRRWEEVIERDLLNNEDGIIAKFIVNAILRGDMAARSSFYEKALGGSRAETAWMTRNEVRDLEELNPLEGGDVLPLPAPVAGGPAQTPIGGPDPQGNPNADPNSPEGKLGRVISATNEKKLARARDHVREASGHLDDVLATVAPEVAPASV